MTCYSLSHLSNPALLHGLATLVTQDRATTADLLAHLAEVDERKLYVPAGYPSMFLYCLRELRMSEDAAYKRIGVARTARRIPVIFPMLADGRLNQTTVLLLASHLRPDIADELLAAATHKTKPEVEVLLAQRFPQPDLPTLLQPIACAAGAGGLTGPTPVGLAPQLAPERVEPASQSDSQAPNVPLPEPAPARARTRPLSPGRFALQLTMGQVTHDLLREAQSLLGHSVAPGDVEAVLQRALRELVCRLRTRKFADCTRPRRQRAGTGSRYIPAEVKRRVCKRDGGRCTFVNESGRRCEERSGIEFDHIEPVTRGGRSTVANLRLRCRAHNQYAAEHALGHEFMRGMRQSSQEQSLRSKARVEPAASSAG
jgi:5-methylcytosine-specific restriction endonuclease McrA